MRQKPKIKDEDDLSPVLKAAVRKAVSNLSVLDLVKSHFFDNSIPLPNRKDFFTGKKCAHCGKSADVDLDDAKAEYKKACDARRRHENLQTKRFKYACFYALGLEDLWHSAPAKIAWSIAWEDGHSAGIYEVYNRFSTLSRIINVM